MLCAPLLSCLLLLRVFYIGFVNAEFIYFSRPRTQPEIEVDLEFQTGPLSVLTQCVKTNSQVLISCRNNRKLLGRVKAFDRHCNLLLENVKEFWNEVPKTGKGIKKATPVSRDRFISKMFLRGDSVILVVRNPR
jgi:small nuclear ribonucleoprotein D2|tara:strand:+ start:289 stop:690 length:402 start_codon:yes stop_codon:yes gene_type:complete